MMRVWRRVLYSMPGPGRGAQVVFGIITNRNFGSNVWLTPTLPHEGKKKNGISFHDAGFAGAVTRALCCQGTFYGA